MQDDSDPLSDLDDETVGSRLDLHRHVQRKFEDRSNNGPNLELTLETVVDRLDRLARESVGVPERIGKYSIRRSLGGGSQSNTWLAFDDELQRHVVIKRYRGALGEMLGEGRALARIRSPSVAACYGIEMSDRHLYLIMEYIPGTTLAAAMRDRTFSTQKTVEIIARLAEGLSQTHACGFVHADIKPANIMLIADSPKLIDFGVSQRIGSEECGDLVGTAAYMAPELVRGEMDTDDPRRDLFGLGAVFYEMLAGVPPFDGEDTRSSIHLACDGRIPAPREHNSRVPSWISNLCMQCLSEDVAGRPPTALDLKFLLERTLKQRKQRFWRAAAATFLLIYCCLTTAALVLPRGGNNATERSDPKALPLAFAFKAPDDEDWNRVRENFREYLGTERLNLRHDFEARVSSERARDVKGRWILAEGESTEFNIICSERCYVGLFKVEFDPDPSTPVSTELLFPDSGKSNFVEKGEWKIPGITLNRSNKAELLYLFACNRYWDPKKIEPGDLTRTLSSIQGLGLETRICEEMIPCVVVPGDFPDRPRLKRELQELRGKVRTLELRNQFTEAAAELQRSTDIEHLVYPNEHQRLMMSCEQLGDMYNNLRMFTDAAAAYDSAASHCRHTNESKIFVGQLTLKLHRARNRMNLDVGELERELKAKLLLERSSRLYTDEKFTASLTAAKNALEIYRTLFTRADPDWAEAYYRTSLALVGAGDIQGGIQHIGHSIDQLKESNGTHQDAESVRTLEFGQALYDRHEFREAEFWLEEGLRKLDNHAQHYQTLIAHGKQLLFKARMETDTEGALPATLDESSPGNLPPRARRYWLDAVRDRDHSPLFHSQRGFRLALDACREELGYAALPTVSLNLELSSNYRYGGYYYLASKCVRDAITVLELHDRRTDPQYGRAVTLRGRIAMDQGKIAAARKDFERAIKLYENQQPPDAAQLIRANRYLADLHLWSGEYLEAQRLLHQALKLSRAIFGESHSETAKLYFLLADVNYELNRHTQARQYHESAMNVFSTLDPIATAVDGHASPLFQSQQAWTHASHYLSHLDSSDPDDAVKVYRRIWQIRNSFLSEQRAIFQNTGRLPEQRKLQSDLRQLHRRIAGQLLAEHGSAMSSEMHQLLESVDTKNRELRLLADTSQTDSTLSIRQLAASLPEGGAYVDIVRANRKQRGVQFLGRPDSDFRYEAFVLQKSDSPQGFSLSWIELGQAKVLDRLAAEWHNSLFRAGASDRTPKQDFQNLHDLGQQLRQQLWVPLQDHMSGCKTIVLKTEGRLANLPFSALPGSKERSYLIEDYSFVRTTDGLIPSLKEKRSVRNRKLLAVGAVDPGIPAGNNVATAFPTVLSTKRPVWEARAGARDEIDRIVSQWPGETMLIVDDSATPSRVLTKMKEFDVLHFANENYFAGGGATFYPKTSKDFSNPQSLERASIFNEYPRLRSWLVLAGANELVVGSDGSQSCPGMMTAAEISHSDLSHVDLVTLCAGNAARGTTQSPLGRFGLHRSFHEAGVRTVVGSLWPVDPQSAKSLIVEFYRNLADHCDASSATEAKAAMPKLQSLRAAQLALLRGEIEIPGMVKGQPVSPVHWAGWVMTGDWE